MNEEFLMCIKLAVDSKLCQKGKVTYPESSSHTGNKKIILELLIWIFVLIKINNVEALLR